MKSYVTLESCVICQQDTGAIFLDRRLRERFEMHTTTPISVCDACREKYLKTGIMLIDPHTGKLAVITEESFKRTFTVPVPKGRICFTEQAVFDMLGI